MVASVANPAWEKQAINKAIRVVRSNPKMVRSVCKKSARTFDTLPSRTPCLCRLMHDVSGNKVDVEGHVAFIPIHITYPNGTIARPNDPLPLPGKRVGLWSRLGCIPMGGSFSAQAADLHSLWGVYKVQHKFRALAELQILDERFLYWKDDLGMVALCQF